MQRVASVDVYRGFVMLLMMAEVLNLAAVATAVPHSAFWQFLAFQQSHVAWTWFSLHDLIQPSFSFLVGVVLPFSISGRKQKGTTDSYLLIHSVKRSLILIFLGIFLRSIHAGQTNFTFEDTLTQIGLGYPFLVLLGMSSKRVQLIAFLVIIVGYWLAFVLYPLPPSTDAFAAHWDKNTNLAWAFDRWFLNLFPRESEFLFNDGGYATLSFIPTLGTMLLGLFAGNLLKATAGTQQEKLVSFLKIGICLIGVGILLHVSGINPIVKRIWTPAWTLFSGGLCFLLLAFFYWIIDMVGKRRWSFPLTVLGVNSIAAYVIADGGIKTFISQSLSIHLGQHYDQLFGLPYATLISGGLILLVEWLILYWMYKQKIFIKI